MPLLVAYAAVALVLVGALIRPGEAGYLASVIRPIALIVAILAVWLMAQLLPLPIKVGLTRSGQARDSIGHTNSERHHNRSRRNPCGDLPILSMIAILFVATAVTIDRLRAERVLFWLVGATAVAAAVQIIHGLVAFEFLDDATKVVSASRHRPSLRLA